MAKKIGLGIYSISIWKNNTQAELHSILTNKSMIKIVQEYAQNNMDTYSDDKEKEALFLFDRVDVEEIKDEEGKKRFDILIGRVKTGEYGVESELVDIEDGSIYGRSATQANVLPFGFAIAVAKGEVNKGIILLQTTGNMGIKSILQKKLNECFSANEIDASVLLGQILPKTYIDNYFKNGNLQKIRMIRYEIPEDVSEGYGINYGVKQTREERTICRPVGFLERKRVQLSEWMAGQRSCTEIIEVDDFEYDDLKLEFKLGRVNKTISLSDTRNIKVNEDITDVVDTRGGNPVYDSLVEILKSTAKEYLIGMGMLRE